jgi:hypothetical protein
MRDGLVDEIGAGNIHESLNDAVQTHLTLTRLPAA